MSSSTLNKEEEKIYNPFLDQAGTPKFKELEPKFLSPAVTSLLESMSRDFTSLEEKLANDATSDDGDGAAMIGYDAVLPEVEKIQSSIEYAWGVAGHLKGVNDSEELREVYQECQPQIVKSFTAFSQSRPLYDALVSIQSSQQWGDDDDVDVDDFQEQQKRRAVDNSIRSMKLGGVALDGEAKERFNEIRLRLAELMTKFMNNVSMPKFWSADENCLNFEFLLLNFLHICVHFNKGSRRNERIHLDY